MLEVMGREAKAFGLDIHWDKVQIQPTTDCLPGQVLSITADDILEVEDAFISLGSQRVPSGTGDQAANRYHQILYGLHG